MLFIEKYTGLEPNNGEKVVFHASDFSTTKLTREFIDKPYAACASGHKSLCFVPMNKATIYPQIIFIIQHWKVGWVDRYYLKNKIKNPLPGGFFVSEIQ